VCPSSRQLVGHKATDSELVATVTDRTTWKRTSRKLKNWVYSRSNLTIVTPSQWLTDQARASMLSRFPEYRIEQQTDRYIALYQGLLG
jgi:hypothetical protein